MYKHDFDILSFLGGILFAGIGFLFLFTEQRWSDIDTPLGGAGPCWSSPGS